MWLSIDQMAELFQRNKSTISRHISKIYEEGELSPMGILKEYMQKGFALDDDRLKRLGSGNYFDELLGKHHFPG